MKKNRETVLQNAEDNFDAFKQAELNKTKSEIFNDAYKINFMEDILAYFENNEFDNKMYAFLAQDKDHILDNLYKHYMKYWDNTISSEDEISDFIRDYCDTYSVRGGEM